MDAAVEGAAAEPSVAGAETDGSAGVTDGAGCESGVAGAASGAAEACCAKGSLLEKRPKERSCDTPVVPVVDGEAAADDAGAVAEPEPAVGALPAVAACAGGFSGAGPRNIFIVRGT